MDGSIGTGTDRVAVNSGEGGTAMGIGGEMIFPCTPPTNEGWGELVRDEILPKRVGEGDMLFSLVGEAGGDFLGPPPKAVESFLRKFLNLCGEVGVDGGGGGAFGLVDGTAGTGSGWETTSGELTLFVGFLNPLERFRVAI